MKAFIINHNNYQINYVIIEVSYHQGQEITIKERNIVTLITSKEQQKDN
jgi:hypothetical protein